MVTNSADPVEAATAADRARPITVSVNGQPVALPDQDVTGLEVKQAAIAQGLPIALEFQLSVKRGNRYQVVDDTDTIKVHQDQEFLAVAPDDNS
jgi:Multiubiquitin